MSTPNAAAPENRFVPAFFLSSAVYSVITPFLALMVRDLGYSTVLVGILLGIFEGAGVAGPLVFGFLADKKQRYRLLLVTSCIIPALVAFPLALLVHPAVSALLLAMMAFGFKSSTSLLDAVTTIQIGAAGNYGQIRVWGSVGFVVGTLCLQWTPFFKPDNALNIAFWITVVTSITVISMLILPVFSANTENTADKLPETQPGKKIITMYFTVGFLLIFFSRFSMAAFYTYFPLYLTEEVKWDAVGLMFALATSTEIPCIFFSARIIRRFGPLPLLALAAFGVCIRLLLWAVFPYKAAIVAAQLLHSLCFGIYHPAAISFFSRVFPPEKRGQGMAIYLALGSGLPALIGNMAGGGIVEAVGFRPLFAIYSAVCGAAVIVYMALRKKINSNLSQRQGYP